MKMPNISFLFFSFYFSLLRAFFNLFSLYLEMSRPLPPLPYNIAREEEKGGNLDAVAHFSRFLFLAFKSLFLEAFIQLFYFLKEDKKQIFTKNELTIEAFHRAREGELIL